MSPISPSRPTGSGFTTTELADINTRSLMTKSLCEMMAEEFPACRFDFLCFPMTPQSGSEPPAEMAGKFKDYDVLIIMTSHSLTHTRAREEACQAGARVASMPGIEGNMFAPGGPMAADYSQIAGVTVQWAEIITAGSDVHVTTPFGTNLRFSIAGRKGGADTGLIHTQRRLRQPAGRRSLHRPGRGQRRGQAGCASRLVSRPQGGYDLRVRAGLCCPAAGRGGCGRFLY